MICRDAELSRVDPAWRHLYRRVWDVADYAVPPVESNAFFVMTNLVITPNQSRAGECREEGEGVVRCTSNTDCPPGQAEPLKSYCIAVFNIWDKLRLGVVGQVSVLGHGPLTGQCDLDSGTCLVTAWCPVERDQLPLQGDRAVLTGADHFTVLIKNQEIKN